MSVEGVRLFSMWYYSWPGIGVFARKNRLVMNWYSFLDHQYNVIRSCLIALKTLKSQKNLVLCPPELPPGLCPRPQSAKMISLQSLFPYKTQSSSTKRTVVKVLG